MNARKLIIILVYFIDNTIEASGETSLSSWSIIKIVCLTGRDAKAVPTVDRFGSNSQYSK